MRTWLIKSDPETYGWPDLLRDGRTRWDGVRSAEARRNLREMQVGDRAMFYHSQSDKAVVGEVEIVKSAYPDPTAKEGDWVCVDIRPLETWAVPVELSAMRSVAALADCSLVRQGRLSVMPMTNEHWKAVQKLRKDAEKEVSLR